LLVLLADFLESELLLNSIHSRNKVMKKLIHLLGPFICESQGRHSPRTFPGQYDGAFYEASPSPVAKTDRSNFVPNNFPSILVLMRGSDSSGSSYEPMLRCKLILGGFREEALDRRRRRSSEPLSVTPCVPRPRCCTPECFF